MKYIMGQRRAGDSAAGSGLFSERRGSCAGRRLEKPQGAQRIAEDVLQDRKREQVIEKRAKREGKARAKKHGLALFYQTQKKMALRRFHLSTIGCKGEKAKIPPMENQNRDADVLVICFARRCFLLGCSACRVPQKGRVARRQKRSRPRSASR